MYIFETISTEHNHIKILKSEKKMSVSRISSRMSRERCVFRDAVVRIGFRRRKTRNRWKRWKRRKRMREAVYRIG